MLKFSEEVIVRIWLHGETHAACTIRTMDTPLGDIVSSHISWFPNHLFSDGVDGNKHVKPVGHFHNVTARPARNYAEDRKLETSGGAQRRYNATQDFEDARQEAERVLQTVLTMNSYQDREQHVQNLINQNDNDLADVRAGRASSRHKSQRWHEFFAADLTIVTLNVRMSLIPNMPAVPFPDIKPDIRFDQRPNQVIRNGQVLTSADKFNLPGLGADPIFFHVKGSNLNPNKPLTQEELQERDAFLQNYPGGGALTWGLNLRGMVNFWNRFVSNDRQGYQFASRRHNCCGVVTEALLAGGMGAYIPVKKGVIYRDTAELLQRVQRLQTTLDELNTGTHAFVNAVKNSGLYDQIALHGAPRTDLWPCATFQQNSRSPNRLGMRREQVAAIDSHLRAYHGIGWSDDNFNLKLEHLVIMMRNVLEHRRLKPQSDRRQGVDSLGIQIVKFLNDGIYRWSYTNPLHTYCSQAVQSVTGRIDRARQVQPRR